MRYAFDLTDTRIGFLIWSYWTWSKKIVRDIRGDYPRA